MCRNSSVFSCWPLAPSEYYALDGNGDRGRCCGPTLVCYEPKSNRRYAGVNSAPSWCYLCAPPSGLHAHHCTRYSHIIGGNCTGNVRVWYCRDLCSSHIAFWLSLCGLWRARLYVHKRTVADGTAYNLAVVSFTAQFRSALASAVPIGAQKRASVRPAHRCLALDVAACTTSAMVEIFNALPARRQLQKARGLGGPEPGWQLTDTKRIERHAKAGRQAR